MDNVETIISERPLMPTLQRELFLSFGSYMSSEIIELVTEDDTHFFVHEAILTFHSKPFGRAISGEWTEATQRKVDLKDWDAATVARLVQFFYTGDYHYPGPTAVTTGLPLDLTVETPSEELTPNSLVEATTQLATIDPDRPLTPLEKCLEGPSTLSPGDTSGNNPCGGAINPLGFDFKETLLAHAKLYALANYISVSALQTLTKRRLCAILSKLDPIQPQSRWARNVTDLATYVYGNTDSLSNSEEPLRKIVSQYIAFNFPVWYACTESVQLMEGGGDFMGDVLGKVGRRLKYLDPTRVSSIVNPEAQFIFTMRLVTQSDPPPVYIKELDSATGEVKELAFRSKWLVPEYTTVAGKAMVYIQISHNVTSGPTINNISPGACSACCGLKRGCSEGSLDKMTEVVMVRCSECYLDMRLFRDYSGITTHVGHSNGEEFLHFLWKSVKTLQL